jgi:SAM-dependent methyltransferase
MKNEVYKRHIDNFSKHWWFQARKEIIREIINNKIKKKIDILDFGSGSGVNIKMLSQFGFVNIYEPHLSTKNYLKLKFMNKNKFKVLSKVKNQKFDLIVLADVLEHLKKDKEIVKKLNNNLKKNGQILITVPAYKFLFSTKDITLGHYRRYNKGEIIKLFKEFELIKLTYFNFFLFVPITFLILLFKVCKINFINKVERAPNQFINKILFYIFLIERKIIKIIDLPFGVSLLGLFKKK